VRRVDAEPTPAELVLVHDMSFIERRSEETRRYLFYFFAALTLSVALITVVIAQLSWRGWVARPARAAARRRHPAPVAGTAPELRPSRATCRRCCASSSTSSGPTDETQQRGRRTRCARCCAARCAATT
jgi:trehalose 6-phosphate synthase